MTGFGWVCFFVAIAVAIAVIFIVLRRIFLCWKFVWCFDFSPEGEEVILQFLVDKKLNELLPSLTSIRERKRTILSFYEKGQVSPRSPSGDLEELDSLAADEKTATKEYLAAVSVAKHYGFR